MLVLFVVTFELLEDVFVTTVVDVVVLVRVLFLLEVGVGLSVGVVVLVDEFKV